jgi:hypothetical protein
MEIYECGCHFVLWAKSINESFLCYVLINGLKQGLKNITERNGINGIFLETERNETENI